MSHDCRYVTVTVSRTLTVVVFAFAVKFVPAGKGSAACAVVGRVAKAIPANVGRMKFLRVRSFIFDIIGVVGKCSFTPIGWLNLL